MPTVNGRRTAGDSDDRGFQLGLGAIASLSGVAVLAIFMIQNTEDVTVSFLFWDFTWPVWLMTLVTATFGAMAWMGLGVVRRHRRRRDRGDERRD